MHTVLRSSIVMEKGKYLICPICKTILPADTEFCVYCGTLFDHDTIEYTEKDGSTED